MQAVVMVNTLQSDCLAPQPSLGASHPYLPSFMHPCICSCTPASVYAHLHLFMHISICLCTHPSFHAPVQLFMHPCMCSCTPLSVLGCKVQQFRVYHALFRQISRRETSARWPTSSQRKPSLHRPTKTPLPPQERRQRINFPPAGSKAEWKKEDDDLVNALVPTLTLECAVDTTMRRLMHAIYHYCASQFDVKELPSPRRTGAIEEWRHRRMAVIEEWRHRRMNTIRNQ